MFKKSKVAKCSARNFNFYHVILYKATEGD